MIESAARANDLPLEFFGARDLQESRFQSDRSDRSRAAASVRRVSRNSCREPPASGRLLDPFDPVQALPKSAEFLSELRKQFGNLGLAAAAYNAGPRRVQEWLAGTGAMPQETRTTSAHHRQLGRGLGQGRGHRENAGPCAAFELPRIDGTAPARAKLVCDPAGTACAARRAKLWGVQLAAGFDRDKALAMYGAPCRDCAV